MNEHNHISDSNVFLFVNRNVHGLVKTVWKLLRIQAIQLGKDGDEAVWNLYGIRSVSRRFYLYTITTFRLISRKSIDSVLMLVFSKSFSFF